MTVHIECDEGELLRYDKRGALLPCKLFYLEHDGECFPDRYWPDFGPILLGMWAESALNLLEGSTDAKLPFMEGPVFLLAHRDAEEIALTAHDERLTWRMPLGDFASMLLTAIKEVLQTLESLNIVDRLGLGKLADRLSIAASIAGVSLE
jgi:hypothetical protein